jgi:hypothetical protein
MASACPCGCGRLVRFNASCMAKRAVYISSLLIVAERMRDRSDRDLERDEWSRFLQVGVYSRDTYLGVAHGEDTTLSDSPVAFAEFRKAADGWEARALSVSRRLWVEDEKWRAAWEGPSYRVPSAAPDVVPEVAAAPDVVPEVAAAPVAVGERADDLVDRSVDCADVPVPVAPAVPATLAQPSARADARISDAVVGSGPMPTSGGADVPSSWVSRPEGPVPVPDRPSVADESPELPTDRTCAVTTCIFCERPAGTLAYLWPEWLCRRFTDRFAAGGIDCSADDGFVERMRNEVDQTVDCVCAVCVHGWMQDLDGVVRSFLAKMVDGEETRLSPRKQALLARWAARTAVVMEYADDNPRRIPRAACAFLRRVGVHAGTQVLLGRSDGNAIGLSHERDLFRRTVDGVEHYMPQATFVIGSVFLQVLTDPWRDNPPTPVEDTTRLLIPLVPVHQRKIDWPPPASIDDSLYDLVRHGTG